MSPEDPVPAQRDADAETPTSPDVPSNAPPAPVPTVVDATPPVVSPVIVEPLVITPTDIPVAPGDAPPASGARASDPALPSGEKKKRRRRRRRGKKRSDAGVPPSGAPNDSTATEGLSDGGEDDESADDDAEVDRKTDGEGTPKVAINDEPSREGGAGKEPKPDATKNAAKKPKKRHAPRPPSRDKVPFGVGEEVVGKVTKVMEQAIMIDVSGKALGIFDRSEIPDSELPAEGEKILGKVSNDGARGGLVVLTRDLNRWQKARGEVEAAFASKQPVAGLVTGVIRGGLEVDVGGLRGFAPASHVDLHLGADLHYLIGQRLTFDVVQFSKGGREFVLSRRAALEEDAKAKRAEALQNIKVGEVVTGTVRSITQFGAFIDVGGVDGLVHMTEASHTGRRLDEVFKVNEPIEVKILRVDEKGKVWLSRRAAEPDPWVGTVEKYARGTRHKGKVARLQPFGAFIELEPGIDGLMHVSDIASPKRFNHPNEVLKVGDEIDVVVAQTDFEHHKIGLHPPPKDLPEGTKEGSDTVQVVKPPPKLALHQAVKVVVEAQELTGLVVRIVGQTGRNAKGYITSMATGTPKGTDLRRAFPLNTELEAKIIELDPRKGIKLSIKALAQDQERQSFRQYQSAVKQASKFGTFGDLLAKKGITK